MTGTSARVRVDRLLEEAAEWRVRLGDESATDADAAAFQAWLAQSEQHRAAFQQADAAWNSPEQFSDTPEMRALRAEAGQSATRDARFGRFPARLWGGPLSTRVAAALVLIALLFGASLQLLPRSYSTAINERRVVTLEDGSKISLDSATLVRVRYSNQRRELWLADGRAKFEVAHDPLRPFTVSARARTVVATGTEFSVEILNEQVRVALYEGAVTVLNTERTQRPAELRSIHLTPGHELIENGAAPATARVSTIDPEQSLSWESGQLLFVDEPLATAVARVNRYSAVPIVINDPEVGRLRISGAFRAGSPTTFVEGVTALLPLQAQSVDGKIILSSIADEGAGPL